MFKKQMLLAMVFITGYAMNSACKEQIKNEKEDATASRINVYDFDHNEDLKKGVQSTTKINGIGIFDWLFDGYIEMQGDADVVKYGNEKFGPREKLSDFNVQELRRCFKAIAPMGYFWDKNREDYDAKHLEFIEALKQGTCVLCPGNTIVMNVKGLDPQQVCAKANFEKRYKANISTTWQQWQRKEKAAQKKREKAAQKK